jgi:nucleoside-diphosphate-sugar epimerase
LPKPIGGERTFDNECVAVTGATGFVGKATIQVLQEGGLRWRALTRGPFTQAVNTGDDTNWVQGDLASSVALKQLFSGADTVVHVAGATKALSRHAFMRVNAIGAFTAAAQAHACGVKHFILISSLAATRPETSAYAGSKAAGEAAVMLFADKMRVTIIRPPAVLGSADPMLAPLFAMLKRGCFPALVDPRDSERVFSVISVSDLAAVIMCSVRSDADPGQAIEPYSVQHVTWGQVHEAAQVTVGRKLWRLPIPAPLLRFAGRAADLFCAITRQTMPISGGKVRELLIRNWESKTIVANPMNLQDIISECLGKP